MKKRILTLCLIAALLVSSVGGFAAFAQVSLEECDKCFQTTMNSLLNNEDVEGNTISATRKPLYDINFEQLGYVYEYDIASGEGYAIVICDNGVYVAQEVMPRAVSPYSEVPEDELCVYVNNMSYYKGADGYVYDIASGEQIDENFVDILRQNAVIYRNTSISDPEYVKVEVYYQHRDPDLYDMSLYPPYFCGSGLTGGCAAVAGGNIVGYFDRYYEDLIPDHVAGEIVSGYYLYNTQDSFVSATINELYTEMNGSSNGITESNFKSGLQSYCAKKGLSCEYTSLMSSGKLNYSSVKSSMKADKPVALFLNTYNICDPNFSDGRDVYNYTNLFGNHVMVGFGYRDITYTLTSGGTSNYRFICVSTGFLNPDDAYFNIDYSTNIISAYGVSIH